MPSIQKAIEAIDRACRVWSVGYDQYNRNDIRDGGETDCSALVIWALKQGGFDTGGATYTGNMTANLTARGWVSLPPRFADLVPGDILLNDSHHVCMVISGRGNSARIAQASIDERGKAHGGRAGDQTGYETNERAVYQYKYGWTRILRYVGGKTKADTTSTPSFNADAALAEDGVLGSNSIAKLQKAAGTPIDGFISGQDISNKKYVPALVAVTWGSGGSALVQAIQTKVGAGVDGYIGPETVKKLQAALGVTVDGVLGHDTALALQKLLNAGGWNSLSARDTAPAPASPAKPQLNVDGVVGHDTVARWQEIMHTIVDGVISGQYGPNKRYMAAITSISWEGDGQSSLVWAIQAMLGCKIDGIIGPNTIKHIQQHLGVTMDGYFGPDTAKALQRRLNEGRF